MVLFIIIIVHCKVPFSMWAHVLILGTNKTNDVKNWIWAMIEIYAEPYSKLTLSYTQNSFWVMLKTYFKFTYS